MELSSEWVQLWSQARSNGVSFRPFVTITPAVSQDGFLTVERGLPTAISSPEALAMTHALRSLHDAVLVGAGTVESDDPLLTTRVQGGRTGVRAILDSTLRLSVESRLVCSPAGPVVVFSAPDAPQAKATDLRSAGVEIVRVARTSQGLSLTECLQDLWQRGVRTLMVEGGASVLDSFCAQGLVDFICITQSPKRLNGPRALPLGPATRRLLDAWTAEYSFRAGPDLLASGRVLQPVHGEASH